MSAGPGARIMLWTQCPISPSRGAAGWEYSVLGSIFDRRLRRSQVVPPSSVAKTPAAEIPIQSFLAFAGSNKIVCNTNPAAPGLQLSAEGWSRKPCTSSQFLPPSRLESNLAGLVPAYSVPWAWQSSDLRELVCEPQRLVSPVHHCGELRI